MAVNLTVCPGCGKQHFRLASEEALFGLADITLFAEGEELTAEWGSYTQINWETSTTTCYVCRECYTRLPEAYAKALDDLLGNSREPHRASGIYLPLIETTPDEHLEAAYEDAQGGEP